MAVKTLCLNAADNVAITPVPRSHKVAVSDIAVGSYVQRYGRVIGKAT